MKTRALVPLVTIASMKILLAALIYSLPGKTAEPWNIYRTPTSSGWFYLFSAWDSAYYYSIAANWYPSQFSSIWAYFPLFPSIIRLLGFLRVDLWLAGMIVANTAGLASVLMFQMVTENYLGKHRSSLSTILYFLLPPVFVFTTVSYSESLFLLLSLLCWYAHIRGNEVSAAGLAALSTLTRSYGLLILFPITFDLLRHRKYGAVSLFVLPFLALIGWFLYAFKKTGVFLAPLAAESTWNTAIVGGIQDSLIRFVTEGDIQALRFVLDYWVITVIGIVSFALALVLTLRVCKLDRSLGIYSALFLLSFSIATILFIPTFASMPRYLSVSFPLGVALETKRKLRFLVVALLFFVMDFVAWWLFLFSTVFH